MGSGRESIVFLGSGSFGIPTLERLAADGRVSLVVSQPDRPAGRGRASTPTPVAAWAAAKGLPLLRSENANTAVERERIRAAAPTFVVIAFGQKLAPELLEGRFAINLHGSLLPRWRGAAPIQRAVMEGDREVGVSVISIAERMDAGVVYDEARTEVGATENWGELHDRLARFGPALVSSVLDRHAAGTLVGRAQDESRVTRARKLSRADARVDFAQPARIVAARINGLAPRPGCDARVHRAGLVGEEPLKLLRARAIEAPDQGGAPGALDAKGVVVCSPGSIELLEVQPPGGRVMPFDAWARGVRLGEGARLAPPPADDATRRDR